MTKQKSFKGRVRGRMAKTGESYTAARRQLIRSSEQTVADAAVDSRTGRTREAWFALLDAWDAHAHKHSTIATWLVETHGVDGWWAQNITVAYEQARGLRVPGQRSDGTFSASVSKTIGVAAERVREAFLDPQSRARWLPDVDLELRSAPSAKALRATGPGGILVIFDATTKGPEKALAAVALEKLPDTDTAAELRTLWRERLSALKQLLEA